MVLSVVDRIINAAILKQSETDRLYKKTLLFNSLKVLIREHPVRFASKISRSLREVENVLKRLVSQNLTTFALLEKDARRTDDEQLNKIMI